MHPSRNSQFSLSAQAGISNPLRRSFSEASSQLKSFTLVELLVSVAVIGVLYAASLYFLRPEILKARARDAIRLSDLVKLQTVLENYTTDTGTPPGVAGLLRLSNVPADASSSPAQADAGGWLGVNLSGRVDKLPIDPINSGSYVYRYKTFGGYYELDIKLESYTDLMKNGKDGDGGNSDGWLEKGTDLTILGD